MWTLEPIQILALCYAWRDEQQRADMRSAIITCTLANIHRDRKRGQVTKPYDIFPWLRRERTMTASEIEAEIFAFQRD